MSRIFLTGDTHIPYDISKLNNKNFPVGKNLTKDDHVIILGDFGLLWNYKCTNAAFGYNLKDNYWIREEVYWKQWLDDKPFTTLFIDGNHENFNRLNLYPVSEWNGGKVHKISESIIHLMRGEIYNIDSKTFFAFGGASSVDRGEATNTVEEDINKIWWPEELPSQTEIDNAINNLNEHHNKVDYILTHTLPNNLLMYLSYNNFDKLTSFLWNIYDSTEFKHWYCGHFHIDKDINYKSSVLYNDIIEITDYN